MNSSHADRIVVAMSGGVDSSVAALLLKEQQQNLVGVSMQVWDYRKNGGCSSKATCCSPDDFTDARKVAAKIDIPYYVFDFESIFEQEVINRFVATYQRGETPNPCVDCNNKVKFRELRNRAESFGCRAVATGHYAKIENSPEGYRLLRGIDRDKDQSYFLYGLTQAELGKTVFPLADLTKDQVRVLAAEAGLSTASKPESQDICFVSGKVQDFLVRIGGKLPSGNLVFRDGSVIGQHSGIHNFTVGQRRGLNISNSNPLYVLEIRSESNEVVVGTKSELEQEGFCVSEVNLINSELKEKVSKGLPVEIEAIAQVRHRHKGVPVKILISPSGFAQVKFISEWCTVSPGQAAVFYDLTSNSEVLGGGRITLSTEKFHNDSVGHYYQAG